MAETQEIEDEKPLAKPRSAKSDAEQIEGLYFGTSEKSFRDSSYHPDSLKRPYNPDPLVQRDYTYGVYEEMMEDDQVDVALNIKKELVIGSGWHIQSEDDDQKKELEAILQDETARPLSEMLQDMIQAYEYGFSVSEKIFKNLNDGRLALKDIKPRHPSTWLLHTDPHGNVERYEQRGMSTNLDINPDSIIHYVNNQRHQNPYGRSDLYAAYQAWMTKRHVTRFYAIFLENAAGAKPVAKYDRRAPQGVVDDIFNAIKKLQTKTAMVIPKDFEVEFLEAKNSGEAYIKGINLFNMFIGRALFIPDLLGFSGGETGGGSFSLGKEQIGLFYKHIYRRREVIERIVDQHILRPICIYNYGMLEEFPKFKFNPLSDEDAAKQAELWIKGVQGAGWEPTPEEVNHFRSLVKFPESDDVIMTADKAMQAQKDAGQQLDEDGKPVENAAKAGAEKEAIGEQKEDDGVEAEAPKKKEFSIDTSKIPGEYKKAVNFELADQTLKTTVARIMNEAKPIIESIYVDLFDQIEKKKIIQNQKIERIDDIKIKNLKQMQLLLKKNLNRLYSEGQGQAAVEIPKKNLSAARPTVPADEFLKFLEQETFSFIGDWSYEITKGARVALIQAIKDGTPLSAAIDMIDTETGAKSEVSLERFARTKTTEVFNKARLDYFNSTGVVDAYQFSAILDERTSYICEGLDGKVFDKADAPIPPLHFNCRSLLIPITRFQDYKIDTENNFGEEIEPFIDENIGTGFSRFHVEQSPKIEEKKKPQITDPFVDFKTDCPDAKTEVITYSKDGVDFQVSTIVYETEEKKKVKSAEHKRLDNDPKV